jgi:hypothetical protein
MPTIAAQTRIDPLRSFVAGACIRNSHRLIPLIATQFDVSIEGGLAIVTTTRIFRNAEEASIEATVTFPVPVHATLFELTARIGERRLIAHAARKSAAREEYEAAIDTGKTAVLHEEVLRGVHMLSVGHIPPGADIEVCTRWALTLTNLGDHASLRIPLTVGDIYGRSGLPDSDDLIHGGPGQMASLSVACSDGALTLRGHTLKDGCAEVPLNAPIDLEVRGWMPKELHACAADGRHVVLHVEPAAAGEAPLDMAILVDHSGSMSEMASGRLTKHKAVAAGLKKAAKSLTSQDSISLWEFDNYAQEIGSTATEGKGDMTSLFARLIARLHGPNGGTEIGKALQTVLAKSESRDILLITDGKSYQIDVQTIAQAGRRIAVVLVGEDSLEANVGHLAGLTGGEIFVAAGGDITEVIAAAIRSLRVPHEPVVALSALPDEISLRRAGMQLSASWHSADAEHVNNLTMRAVAAVAAGLAFPALPKENAATFAEAEGLVTHLTSLLLVDEEGQAQDGLPTTRKVALPTPAKSYASFSSLAPAPAGGERGVTRCRSSEAKLSKSTRSPAGSTFDFMEECPDVPGIAAPKLAACAELIPWEVAHHLLRSGNLDGLNPAFATLIHEAAAQPEVTALAARMSIDAIVLVIALMARHQAESNRTAARLARSILGGQPSDEVEEMARSLGLDL